jgi:hypothetical protein
MPSNSCDRRLVPSLALHLRDVFLQARARRFLTVLAPGVVGVGRLIIGIVFPCTVGSGLRGTSP